jgi:hypothetical protein
MAKHHRVWNQDVYERRIREGLGAGSGADYTPWIHVQDFASNGVVSRVKGRTTGRVHHLMSNNELAYFYILDWSDSVTDIREQYPLSDLSCIMALAAQAGIKYPTDNISGYPYVLTCDFMITTADGLKARTIKMTSELKNARTIEKLEIERRYWLEKGIDWKIVTEREISRQKARNIEWLYTADKFCMTGYSNKELESIHSVLLELVESGNHSIVETAKIVDNEFLLPTGTGLSLFKQLVLDRKIVVDLNKPLNLTIKGVTA